VVFLASDRVGDLTAAGSCDRRRSGRHKV